MEVRFGGSIYEVVLVREGIGGGYLLRKVWIGLCEVINMELNNIYWCFGSYKVDYIVVVVYWVFLVVGWFWY